jgi:hypothetical protein
MIKKTKNLKRISTIHKPKYTNVYVVDNSYSHVTQEADPDDAWSADSTSTDHNILGLTFKNNGNFLNVPFKIEASKSYFLLYVIYSTGNSFSNHDGAIDFIELYEDYDSALRASKIIQRDRSADYNIEIFNSLGFKYKISCSWKGYFENLQDVCIKEVKLLDII